MGVSDESKAYRLYDPVSKKIIISKDVIFQEDECWNWGKSNEECRSDVLKWNDDGDENNMEEGIENNEEEGNIEGEVSDVDTRNSSETGVSSSQSTENDSPILNEGRVRGPPSWAIDYVTGEGLSDEDGLNAMIMLTEDDPFTFEQVVKSKKWRDAMMAEIVNRKEQDLGVNYSTERGEANWS